MTFRPELRHYFYMVALADELHFGRAAAKVGIAQPPFSQQIQNLERNLGCVLIERKPKLALTVGGREFVATGRELIKRVDECVEAVRSASAGESGPVRVGFAGSTLTTSLPLALRRFRDARPNVHLDLREMSTSAQLKAIAEGKLDLGITRAMGDEDDRVVSTPILREAFVAVLPADHDLAMRKRIHLTALHASAFVLFPPDVAPGLHRVVRGLFEESGFEPNVVMEALEWTTIVGLVEAGIGVSVVPASFKRLRLGGVSYVNIQADAARATVATCLPRSGQKPAAVALAATIKATFDQRAYVVS